MLRMADSKGFSGKPEDRQIFSGGFCMAAIKEIGASAEKWTRRASAAAGDLVAGVRNPRRPWAESALAAGENYKQAVIAAANQNRFVSGVRAAGEEKWRLNTEAKVTARYPEGVSLAQGEWQRGFSPYQQVISSLSLPQRGVRGSPANYQRGQVIGQAMSAARARILGGSRT